MDAFESIADRRIDEARKAGLFDNLPGAGKPIPDLDRERPPGWWADRVIRRERSILAAEDLDHDIARAMPGLWRVGSEAAVRDRVGELNDTIDAYNRVTTWEPRRRLDEAELVDQWHRLRRYRAGLA